MAFLPTGTVTFLFTDIEGSTTLLQRLGDRRYAEVLEDHRRILRDAFMEGHGQEIDTQGDAFLVAFSRARDALGTAVAAQRAIARHVWPDGASLRVRMGLHTGEPLSRDTGYVGIDVHRAARIAAAAHGGQILLSDVTHGLVMRDLSEGMNLRYLGEHRLKDLAHQHRLFQVVAAELPVDFPPIRSLAIFPNNLPRQLTSFVGREHEMAEIQQLLSAAYLVTLAGSGGAGKTRLALQLAVDVVEDYRDGVWLAEFAPLADPALVPKTVASILNLPEQPGRDMTDTLVDALRPKALLLLFDNCEHLLAACRDLAATILHKCPHVRILATSREGLGVPGEALWRVPSLSVPEDVRHLPPPGELVLFDAVRLFVDRAVAAAPGFTVTRENAPAVAQVCQRLDGIPLAIELAAARVKVLAVEQIAARLDDRFRLLTGGSQLVLPHHQTLRGAIDWSYNLLSETERVMLRRLSVFAGGWTLEAAESICAVGSVDAAGILDLLTSLVDKSLVIAEPHGGETRYRLLETVRQYARDRLAESGESAQINGRHRGWYREFVELAEPKLRTAEQDAWISRLEVEHDNLRGALTWSLAEMRAAAGGTTPAADLGLRLAGALWWFWFIRGHFSEGRRWLQQMLGVGEGAPTSLRGRGLVGQGVLTLMQGDLRGGTALLEESLRLSHAAEDFLGTAWATGWLGVPALHAGDNKRAMTYFDESLGLWRQLGDPWGIAWMAGGLGNVLALEDETQRAVSLLNEALGLCRKVGDKLVTALTLHHSAYLAIARGDTEEALPLVEETLSLVRALGARREIPRALGNLGLIAHRRGDYGRAAAAFRESLALFREVGDKRGIALCFERLPRVAGAQRRLTRAARLFGASEALREVIGVAEAVSGRAAYEFGHVATWRPFKPRWGTTYMRQRGPRALR
jgi:predicted ATPase/class 3 adenylate cyclase